MSDYFSDRGADQESEGACRKPCRTSQKNSERRQRAEVERLVSWHGSVIEATSTTSVIPCLRYALIEWKKQIRRDAVLEWYLGVNAVFRAMRQKAFDAQGLLASEDKAGAKLVNGYLKTDYQSLRKLWTDAGFPEQDMGNLGRHIGFGDANDYDDILARDLPQVEARAEAHVRDETGTKPSIGFEQLLHPVIFAHAFQHYVDGHYRDAVLNSVVAIFDLMRERTGLDLDGAALATQVLSLEKPHLILSELDTESGRNDQKGFMQILVGAYLGIRNPKAHSLNHDLDPEKAAQYLILRVGRDSCKNPQKRP